MEHICIRFAGMDETTGALFLQFSLPENVSTIDQNTIHGFFPWEHEAENFEQLIPHITSFGYTVLAQQQANPSEHQFNKQQIEQYSALIGTSQTIEIDPAKFPVKLNEANQYNPDTLSNPNSQVDQMRVVILEILAEEGLIPGNVK